jgi:hypothetical protein
VKPVKDEVYQYNVQRWQALTQPNALFTRPRLDLNQETAREYLGLARMGVTVDVTGLKVPCLASGGGQQSIDKR